MKSFWVGGAACLLVNDESAVCLSCGGPGQPCCGGDDYGYIVGNGVSATQNTCWSGEACPASVPLPASCPLHAAGIGDSSPVFFLLLASLAKLC
jgi:hypothetical protein